MTRRILDKLPAFRPPLMTPAPRIFLALAIFALAGLAERAEAALYPPAVQRVLERAQAATGGGGWNQLRGWHETGRDGGVRYEAWLDPLRYGMRVETREAAGLHVHGFNGGGDWQIYPSGVVTGVDDRPTVALALTNAFFRVHGYFFPGRYDARGDYLGVRSNGGRAFEVLRIHPVGGLPREMWFDRRTGLLARIVDRTGARAITTEFSDYRRVGPVRVAFRVSVDDGAAGAQERQLEALTFTPADRALFSLPRPGAPVIAQQATSARR